MAPTSKPTTKQIPESTPSIHDTSPDPGPEAEANERTSLLSRETVNKPIDAAVTDEVPARERDAENGNGSVSRGEGEGEGENPLYKGNAEMLARMHLLFPAVAIGVLLSAADQTIIASSYGRIGSDLQALNNTSWIATAYFLTLTSFQPLYGKLSDIFGRKPCLLFAYTVFGLGCLFCGVARNLNELVAARAFAGIGGGGMTTVVSILFSDVVPLRNRGTWQGYMNIVFATGASLGAPLGGILSDSIGWRWAFIGQFPMTIVASIAVYFVLDLPKQDDGVWLSKLKKIDFLGAFTLVLAITALLIGLDRGSNVAWSDKYTLIFGCCSVPLIGLFILVETKIASNPFAPGHIIFKRSLFASYASNFFQLSSYMGLIYYIPLYFQAVNGMSATAAGIRLIPPVMCSVSGSLFSGFYMKRTGKYYWLTISCVAIGFCGTIITFICSGVVISSVPGMVIGLSINSFGGGSTIVTTLINVIANADPKDQAIATACTYLFRSLGSAVGVSVAATVIQQKLRTGLRDALESGNEADEIVEKVRQSLEYIKTLDPGTRDLVRRCYQLATSTSFALSGGLLFLSLVSVTLIKSNKLSK